MTEKVRKTEQEWRELLTDEQYIVLREHGTERPFTGQYVNEKTPGVYRCAACDQALFSSDTKFKSGTGWPSFYDVIENGNVELREDTSYGMRRVEVLCSRCESHLGHVFEDGPRNTTGLRYCINSVALNLDADDNA
ncbi:MAG: peptide-methionine (R)-S-oxide reductase MsrB [Chloroflexota bacterium]